MLDAGANNNIAANDGATPLQVAASRGTTWSCARCATPTSEVRRMMSADLCRTQVRVSIASA